MLNRCPATVIVPMRGGPDVAATTYGIDAVPFPFALDVMVIQSASDDAVHVHCWLDATTSTTPDPPLCEYPAECWRR